MGLAVALGMHQARPCYWSQTNVIKSASPVFVLIQGGLTCKSWGGDRIDDQQDRWSTFCNLQLTWRGLTVRISQSAWIVFWGRVLRSVQPHYLRAEHGVATSITNIASQTIENFKTSFQQIDFQGISNEEIWKTVNLGQCRLLFITLI